MSEQQQERSTTKGNTQRRKKNNRKSGNKILFFTAKWLFIIMCLFFSGIIGLVVGFSILGNGTVGDVFDLSTWIHVYNLIFSS